MKVSCDKAIEILRSGDLVALPTETVYGLAAPINQQESLKKVFALKKRPFFDPLIVHIADLSDLWPLVSISVTQNSSWRKLIEVLAGAFWPGPLTLVLPKSDQVSDIVTSGLDTVGIRMPRHADFLKVIQGVGSPLAAPSANLFGRTSPTQAEHVEAEFPTLPVVDGGSCPVGIESTILKISLASQVPHRNLEKRAEGPSPTVEIFQLEILRPGGITQEQIKKELSLKATSMGVSWVVQARQADRIESPGQIKHHYMPKKPLLLVKSEEEIATALKIISFESPSLKMPLSKGWSLGLSKEPTEAARELYSRMRELDLRPEAFGFVVGSLLWLNDPNWEAILDRLRRAASWSSI